MKIDFHPAAARNERHQTQLNWDTWIYVTYKQWIKMQQHVKQLLVSPAQLSVIYGPALFAAASWLDTSWLSLRAVWKWFMNIE